MNYSDAFKLAPGDKVKTVTGTPARIIVGEFVKLEGNNIVLRINGGEIKTPIAWAEEAK